MKKFKKIALWITINAGLCYLLYIHNTGNESYPLNILYFMLILNFVTTVICSLSGEALEKIKEEGLSVSKEINFAYGTMFAIALAGSGLFFLAGIDIFTTYLQLTFYKE